MMKSVPTAVLTVCLAGDSWQGGQCIVILTRCRTPLNTRLGHLKGEQIYV